MLRKETAFPRCRITDSRWNKKPDSLGSSVTAVILRPNSCITTTTTTTITCIVGKLEKSNGIVYQLMCMEEKALKSSCTTTSDMTRRYRELSDVLLCFRSFRVHHGCRCTCTERTGTAANHRCSVLRCGDDRLSPKLIVRRRLLQLTASCISRVASLQLRARAAQRVVSAAGQQVAFVSCLCS